jgi:hypothetical protein
MVAQAGPLLRSRDSAIKLLDLLTNRYHVGIVRETTDAGLNVELPATSHFQPGQRVRFIVAGDQPIVARHDMQRGFITQVTSDFSDRLTIRLAFLPETAVA